MSELSSERIAGLQQAAMERDPNPEPLDTTVPEGRTRVTVHRHAGQLDGMEHHTHDLPGEVTVETTETGALMVHSAGTTLGFAPGYWAFFDITEATDVEGGEPA